MPNIARRKRGVAWNSWYHCTAHTYGAWLRGDRRGWRTRHHREHVDGDYKNPPAPGTWEKLNARSRSLMKRAPVRLSLAERTLVLQAFVDRLLREDIELLCASLSRDHLHLLARFPLSNARTLLGLCKKHASHELRNAGHAREGGLWAVRSRAEPIASRAHQLRTVDYVLAHTDQGGATWFFKDGQVRPPRKP